MTDLCFTPRIDMPIDGSMQRSTLSTQESNESDDIHTQTPPEEMGGAAGLEPTRYGDWEKNGRCIDF